LSIDTSAGRGDGAAAEVPDDDLTFAVHDLGRERATEEGSPDLGFAPATLADPPAVASDEDGFVIRQPQSVAPAAPVDALVVGAPEPAPSPQPATSSPNRFMIGSSSAGHDKVNEQELWMTREPAPEPTPAPTSRRGWSTRHSQVVDRSAHATMLRLREEAVNVSWKSAWIAVTSADPRLLRKRGSLSSSGD
jgi:hypothetical protein